jgi:hypothetical protein
MGIKGFSQIFKAVQTVKSKDLKGETIVIDTNSELMRAALGAKSTHVLTDSNGNPTLHISVLLAVILDFYVNHVDLVFGFDHNQDPDKEFHNPDKLEEIMRRRKVREKANTEIQTLKQMQEKKPLFSDSEDSDTETKNEEEAKARIQALEKRAFRYTKEMINDIKLMITCLGYRYVEAPVGFEGEHICSWIASTGVGSAVYSGDTDPIPFGAPILLRKNPRDKLIYKYTQSDIIKQIKDANDYDSDSNDSDDPTIYDIRKICVIAGAEGAEKTPGVGPKTILQKYDNIKLTKAQKHIIQKFAKVPDVEVKFHNEDRTPFADKDKINLLIDWLVDQKSFNRARVTAQIEKAIEKHDKPSKTKASKVSKAKSTTKSDKESPTKVSKKPLKRIGGKVCV